MKTKFLLMLVIVLGTFTNCQDPETSLYDDASLSYFTNGTSGKYYIQENVTEGFKVEVGITEQVDFNRTITIEVDQAASTATTAEYQIASSLFIPANSNIGYVEVIGDYNNVQSGSKIVFDLKSVQSSNVATFNNKYTLELFQFCPLVRDDFIGNWSADEEGYQVYPVTVVAGAADNEIVISRVWDADPNSTTSVFLDDSDPANFVLGFPDYQDNFLYNNTQYGPAYIDNGRGTFDACNKVVDMYFQVRVQAGLFSETHITFTKQ